MTTRTLEPCPHCHQAYFHSLTETCPWCGLPRQSPQPKPQRGWGGKRAGAGAPVSNLNRLIHGGQSKLLKRGIERMCDDPEMRAVLHIIARLATEGSVPPQTKRTVQAIMNKKGASYATR